MALFLANFILLAMNIPLVGIFTRVLMVPTRILMPVVGFGVAGWLLRKLEVPLVPVIL